MSGMDSSFGGFESVNVMIMLIFILLIGVFAAKAIIGITNWFKNNNSPVLIVEAKVVGKRSQTSHHNHQTHTSGVTRYFATFEVESGDRIEFHLGSYEYSMLAERDSGKLKFQGSRYLEFNRK